MPKQPTKFRVTWKEIHVGYMVVDTKEEAEFCTNSEGKNLDDPRYKWDMYIDELDYEEVEN